MPTQALTCLRVARQFASSSTKVSTERESVDPLFNIDEEVTNCFILPGPAEPEIPRARVLKYFPQI